MKYFILITICFLSFHCHAQWHADTSLFHGQRIIYSIPSTTPYKFDTLYTHLISVKTDTTDSAIGLQVLVFDSAYFTSSSVMFDTALAQTHNDTLHAISKVMLLVSNSTLTAFADTTTSGKRGIEAGIKYSGLGTNTPYYSFIRYYLYNHTFVTFAITGSQSYVTRLTTYKNKFFNSIKLL